MFIQLRIELPIVLPVVLPIDLPIVLPIELSIVHFFLFELSRPALGLQTISIRQKVHRAPT